MKRIICIILVMWWVVSPAAEYKKEIYVNPDGNGDFVTLTEAFEAIRAYMDYDVTVHIANGVYREKVVVPSWIKNVHFIGENRDSTIITWSDHANINNMGTFRTYTMRIDGDAMTFENLTIENNAPKLGQAVAVHTEGDRLTFINCRFLGNQDTLFTGGEHTRLYFYKCYIEGTTDFIFGAATAVFRDCEIYCKSDSYITAASTPKDEEYGYIFDNCTIKAADNVKKMYLGRPWRPYAYTAFIDCTMEAPICAEGWHNWRNPDNEKTARYSEYGSKGTYGDMSRRAAWSKELTAEEVAKCRDLEKVLRGWNPDVWSHGKLQVSPDGRYLQHADGTPFFWLADTGWLLPEKLDKEEAISYLNAAADAGYNVVMVQVINGVPATNAYGQKSHPHGWDLTALSDTTDYGYWEHLDYIIDEAARRGINIGMVCIWGGLVKGGKMDAEQAKTYGKFLAERYKDCPNIVWIIGGDCKGDIKPEVWEALATTIKSIDNNHLMTYHPFGRTSSAYWWHDADWLDFNMFQSGHRRYDQRRGDGDDNAAAAVAEDNWRYVADGLARKPAKPILDGEPSYEGIPQGLHDITQPRWQAADARRYAYWSVFAGAAGHTYGHNSVMQMFHPGDEPAYGADMPWYEAVREPGYSQLRHLKDLIMEFDYFSRIPDQSVILDNEGTRYWRPVATRGDGYILVYTYEPQSLTIDLTKIEGENKEAWWMDPIDGIRIYIGEVSGDKATFTPTLDHDSILIIRTKNKELRTKN